jgi:nitroreductase
MASVSQSVSQLKRAPSVEGVLPVFLDRWSARAFSDQPVSPADLKKVFEAARWAPSAYNEQPWRFIVGVAGTETHKKLAAVLISFNQLWAPKAPVLILGIAKSNFSHNDTANAYALYDLGAATASLSLQAAALGLSTHQMAGFDHDAARKALAIPQDYTLGAITALGYPGEPDALGDEKLVGMEKSPRSRKALGEIALSAWDQSAKLG